LAIPFIGNGTSSGSRDGGYLVTYSGHGFGDESGKVYVGNIEVDATWNDTWVQFIMPEVPSTWGQAFIKVETEEGASSNSFTFTFN
jgi:hypothetical protein